MTRVVVAVDGPAGAGKSTVAGMLAARLGIVHIDSGATYRLVGLRARGEGVSLDDGEALGSLATRVADACALGPGGALMFNGEHVGAQIRLAPVAEAASRVAVHPQVRSALVALQRKLVPPDGAVVEGRDIGTVVLPQADLKVYLDADETTRADRLGGGPVRERDERDTQRAESPLQPADDAVHIDTTRMTPDEVVETILAKLARHDTPDARLTPPDARLTPPDARLTPPDARLTPPDARLTPPDARLTPPDPAGASSGAPPVRRPRPSLVPPPNPRHRVLRRAVWTFAWLILVGWFRLVRGGRRQVPRTGAAILAPNHRSLVDIPAVAMLTRRKIWFMGKEELFRSRLLGWFLSALGGFPVKRGTADRRALELSLELLSSGEVVVVYPEGTRRPDTRFQEIEDGLSYLALRSGAPVVPVALLGTEAILPPGAKLPRRPRVVAIAGRPVELGGPVSTVTPRARRAATERLRAALKAHIDAVDPPAGGS